MQGGCDHGTLYQIRNLIQRRNVGKKTKKDFNAHDSFFSVVTIPRIILAAAIEVLGMDSLDDTPCELLVPKNVHTNPKSLHDCWDNPLNIILRES